MPAFRYSHEEWQADLSVLDVDAAAFTGPNPLQKLNGRWKAAMARVHPDKGGTDEEAKAVNIARDRLREWFKLGMPTLPRTGQAQPRPGQARPDQARPDQARPDPPPHREPPRPPPPPPPRDPPPRQEDRGTWWERFHETWAWPPYPVIYWFQRRWGPYASAGRYWWGMATAGPLHRRHEWQEQRERPFFVWLRAFGRGVSWLRYLMPAHVRSLWLWRWRRYTPMLNGRTFARSLQVMAACLVLYSYALPTLNRWAWERWRDDPHRHDNPDAVPPPAPPVERKAAPARPLNIPAEPGVEVMDSGKVIVRYDAFPPGFTPILENWTWKYKGDVSVTSDPAYARDGNLVQVDLMHVTMGDDMGYIRNVGKPETRTALYADFDSMIAHGAAKLVCWYSSGEGRVGFRFWYKRRPDEMAHVAQLVPRTPSASITGAAAACPPYRR